MKNNMKYTRFVIFCLIIIFLNLCLCKGETKEVSDEAVMEKKEKESLYSAIQGFVGSWWNGSNLYPDPCGWTPIQVFINFFLFCLIKQ